MEDWKWVIQIVLIPIITILLSLIVDGKRELRKRTLEKDQELFIKFIDTFPDDGNIILRLKNDSFGVEIKRSLVSGLISMEEMINKPSFVFGNKSIENKKQILHNKLKLFFSLSIKHFFPHNRFDDCYELTYANNYEKVDEFQKLYKQFDKITDNIYTAYVEFIQISRKKL